MAAGSPAASGSVARVFGTSAVPPVDPRPGGPGGGDPDRARDRPAGPPSSGHCAMRRPAARARAASRRPQSSRKADSSTAAASDRSPHSRRANSAGPEGVELQVGDAEGRGVGGVGAVGGSTSARPARISTTSCRSRASRPASRAAPSACSSPARELAAEGLNLGASGPWPSACSRAASASRHGPGSPGWLAGPLVERPRPRRAAARTAGARRWPRCSR